VFWVRKHSHNFRDKFDTQKGPIIADRDVERLRVFLEVSCPADEVAARRRLDDGGAADCDAVDVDRRRLVDDDDDDDDFLDVELLALLVESVADAGTRTRTETHLNDLLTLNVKP